MKSFKIIADPRVKLDLKEAKEFLKTKRKNLELKFLQDYKTSLIVLKTNPFFEISYDNIRCLPLKKFQYMIHFVVNEDENTVTIYGLISTFLNPEDSWLIISD